MPTGWSLVRLVVGRLQQVAEGVMEKVFKFPLDIHYRTLVLQLYLWYDTPPYGY